MNLLYPDAVKLASALSKQVSSSRSMEVIICPSLPYVTPILEQLRQDNRDISVGAQDCHTETSGAYTGEISAEMLASCWVKYVILGHSERRAQFGENEELLRDKIQAALSAGLKVIYCVGETLEQRDSDSAFEVVKGQLLGGLKALDVTKFEHITLAYEPVWAIGTGKTATPEQAQDMHAEIRNLIANKYTQEIADGTSILYGGSVKPHNAEVLFGQADVDGGLVGGASLKVDDFLAIINASG